MSAEQLEQILEAQRRLLWPLPAEEREQRLAEVKADYLYEETLAGVAGALEGDAEIDHAAS